MNTEKLKKYVLPNLPYLFIFWFADKLGMAYRLTAGTSFGTKLFGMIQTINAAFSSFAPSVHPQDLFAGLVGTAIIYAVVYFRGKNAKKFRKGIEYGSARCSTFPRW